MIVGHNSGFIVVSPFTESGGESVGFLQEARHVDMVMAYLVTFQGARKQEVSALSGSFA
jgi:hypothetical protein